jgi:hypothetical protein
VRFSKGFSDKSALAIFAPPTLAFSKSAPRKFFPAKLASVRSQYLQEFVVMNISSFAASAA